MRDIDVTPELLSEARRRLLQMHFESGVGHLGGNLSCLDALMLVFHEFLSEGDEFVLSKGHAAGALYIALWSLGCLSDDDLRTFHGEHTLLPGHPPSTGLPLVSFATGSLGHGLSLASGTALAFKLRSEARQVFCLMSDGEWQEGASWEALIFACHHRLKNLTILIDNNGLQGFGRVSEIASIEPLATRLAGFGAEVRAVSGHSLADLRKALTGERARSAPRIFVMQTTKGKGISFLQDRMESHYLPLSRDQYDAALLELAT